VAVGSGALRYVSLGGLDEGEGPGRLRREAGAGGRRGGGVGGRRGRVAHHQPPHAHVGAVGRQAEGQEAQQWAQVHVGGAGQLARPARPRHYCPLWQQGVPLRRGGGGGGGRRGAQVVGGQAALQVQQEALHVHAGVGGGAVLVPGHGAIRLLLGLLLLLLGRGRLGGCGGLQRVVVAVWRGRRSHVATHGGLHEAVVVVAHAGAGHGVGAVHVHGEGALGGLFGGGAYVAGHRARLLLHGTQAGGSGRGRGAARHPAGRQPRLLCVALLQVARQVVPAPEALGAARAQEVAAASVHHGVPADIFACVEAAVAALTRVLPLPDWHSAAGPRRARGRGRPVVVAAQVLQQGGGSVGTGQARRSAVRRHQVPPVPQLGVVLFTTLLALEELPVGWVGLLQLAL